jgi:DNA-binding MarR family transcriptional regulator
MTKMRRLCMMAVNKRLSLVGSSMPVYSTLFRLVHEAEVPQHELAFDAAIDPAAASRLVRDMVAEGLVTTRVDPADKRQRFVKLTAKGRTLESTLRRIVDDALEPYMVGLTAAEEQEFLRLLRKAHDMVVTVATEGQEIPMRTHPRARSTPTEPGARAATREPSGTTRAQTHARPAAREQARVAAIPGAGTARKPGASTVTPRSRSTR